MKKNSVEFIADQTAQEIANHVRAQMAAQRKTILDVARVAKVGTRTVTSIRKGDNVGRDQIVRVLFALNCQLRVSVLASS